MSLSGRTGVKEGGREDERIEGEKERGKMEDRGWDAGGRKHGGWREGGEGEKIEGGRKGGGTEWGREGGASVCVGVPRERSACRWSSLTTWIHRAL